MVKYRFRTLQQSLFAYYSAVFIVFSLIVASLLYVFLANDIRNRSAEQQKQLGNSMVGNLDQEIVKMNNFSMNIVYSNLVKEHFSHYLSPAEDKEQTLASDPAFYKDTTTLIDVILAIISSSNTAKQANIYDVNGNMLGAGAFNGQLSVDLTQRPWYEETWTRNGWRVISVLDGGTLPMPTGQGESGKRYLSLTRVYKDGNYVSQGVVEILQDAGTLFQHLNDVQAGNEELSVYVVNERNEILYPFLSHEQQLKAIDSDVVNLIGNNLYPSGTMQEVVAPNGNSKQMMTYTTSQETGWTVIVMQSKQSLFANLNRTALLFIGATLVTLMLILLLSYLISKRVTLPLHRLQRIIQKTGVHDLTTGQDSGQLFKLEYPGSIREMDELNDTFIQLNQQLVQSFQDMLAVKSQETDARLLALQSQMNPHFLYNNITNISIMAEEGMNEQIVVFCGHIASMLRYISAPNKNGVPLEKEIDYCERYLECMKIRFEDDLLYEFHVPDSMKSLQVPMLLIQPLLENAMKYGLRDNPPWKLHIIGELDSMQETWRITVEDNGPGMEPEALMLIQQYIQQSQEWERMPELEINGMGLKNIWIRLKLWYGSAALMHITNHSSGGVSITIGGSIRKGHSESHGHDI
ncbi:sensor histidine kinase [Chryseobacterium mucoviscidosis]|uniref:cache domain-containing sensor histidine kinase n=1 Tax=unclassified Paenibacillus TaxID=185978 RepID=UPI0009A3AFB7|nr:sensor histidine kinase [Paenibacillus sp. 11B]MDN8588345.1 histidine kinase [Paenibacillus sp. 11B]OPG96571.1 sensor histidine kinase [Chryseobacterium mucoviscidosis]